MKIEIQEIDRVVEVPDSFASLTESEKNDYVDRIIFEFQKNISEEIENDEKNNVDTRPVLNTLRSVGQGLTFGFSDEIAAKLRSLASDRTYDEIVGEIRSDLETYRKQNPGLSLTSEMTGAIVPALISGLFTGGSGTGATLATTAARATPSIGRTALKGAGIGAGYGGLYGAGTSDDGLKNRLVGAGTGATIGAATGAVLPTAMLAGGTGIRRLSDAMNLGGSKRAENFAQQKVLQGLQRDDLTPEQAMIELDKARKLGVNEATLADLGTNMRSLGYSSQALPNPSRTKIAQQLDDRSVDQADRITEQVVRRSKLEGPFSKQYVDDLASKQQELAGPIYREAYEKSLPAGSFKKFFEGPRKDLFIQASKEARKLARADGRDIPDLSKVLKDEQLSKEFFKSKIPTEYLHDLKKGLDVIIDRGTDNLTGKMTKYAGVVSKQNKQFNDVIKKLNTSYKKANEEYADLARLQNAYDKGEKFNRQTSYEINKFLKGKNNAEKEAYRVGLISNIKNRSVNANDSRNFVTEVFGSPKKRESMKLAFPNNKSFKEFEEVIKLEKGFVTTKNKVLGGSPTKERMLAVEDAGTNVSAVAELVSRLGVGDVVGAIKSTVQQIGPRVGGLNPESANMISRMLFETTPAQQKAIINSLNSSEKELVKQAINYARLQQAGTALTSGQAVALTN